MSPSLASTLFRAKEAGLRLYGAEMQRPLPPPERNAAPLYVTLVAFHGKGISDRDRFGDKNVPWGSFRYMAEPPDAPRLAAYLKRHRTELNILRVASKRPDCVFTRDWMCDDPNQVTFPEFAAIRHGARILYAESQMLALQNRYPEAVEALSVCLRAARHAGNEQLSISYLVRTALEAIALSGLRKLLYYSQGDPEVSRLISRAINREWRLASYANPLQGEAWFQYQFLELGRRLGPDSFERYTADKPTPLKQLRPSYKSEGERLQWGALLDANESLAVDRLTRAVAVADLPLYQSRPVLQPIGDEAKPPEDSSPNRVFADVLSIDLVNGAEKRANIYAMAQVTQTACALFDWRAKQGRFPERLDQAVSPLPVDPYDGRPLRYRCEGAGFVLYSVGPTGKFDGGSPNTKPSSAEAAIAFRFPRPRYVRPASEYRPNDQTYFRKR
jgi:hypothetical protein